MGQMMRYSQAKILEFIRLVERSSLPIKQTRQEPDIYHKIFYRRYLAYQENGVDGVSRNSLLTILLPQEPK